MKRTSYWIILIVICSLPLLWGVIHSGLFVSDDGSWMVIRLSAFYSALTSGQLPVRMLPQLNQGFGYPVADFLYPLFLYVGSVLHLLKIPFLLDVKIIIAVSIIFSGIGMFLFLRKHFSNLPAFFGALFYLYLPYHLYDIYTRGSVGEIVSLAIAPFLFWAVERKSWVLLALFIGLLIPAHNTLALFFLPIVLVFAYFREMKIKQIIFATIVGLGLSTFFWFPALFDKQFTVFDSIAVANPLAYFTDKVSFLLLGWVSVAVFGAVIFLRFSLKEKATIFFFVLGIISIFLSLSLSSFLWQSKFLSEFVQFPFRFLSLTILAESFLAAYCFEKIKTKVIPIAILILLLLFSCIPYLFPRQYDYAPDSFYATNTATTTVQNEYMPKWVKNTPTAYAYQKVFINSNLGSISQINQKGTRFSFIADMKKNSNVLVSFVYFPGWIAAIDGKPIFVNWSNEGLVQLRIPKGQHVVNLWFGETPVRLFADALSIISFIALLGVFFKQKYA